MSKVDKYIAINKVLMEWNPLSVIGPALDDEYIGLVPAILAQDRKSNLASFLKQALSSHYGVDYEEMDTTEREKFQAIIERISIILRDK